MIVETILIGLAGFRIASLLTRELGPFGLFLKIRNLSMRGGEGEMPSWQGELHYLYSCMWCATVWGSLIAAGLWFLEPWIVRLLAAMTVAVIVEEKTNSGD